MIRVNLLHVASEEPVRSEWMPREQRSTLLGVGLLIFTFLGVGASWWYLSGQRASLQSQIDVAEAELVRLQQAAELVEAANQRKAELEERLTLIDRLRAAKRGPVTLLETVSRAIPDGLWLMEMDQEGAAVTIDGRSTSLTSVTDFAQQMQNSGFFERPVEILSTVIEVYEETPVVRFSVRAMMITPTVESSTASGAPAPPADDAPSPQPGA